MKFKSRFDTYNVLNNGSSKIPLIIDADEYSKIEQYMTNFRGREITVEISIDAEAEKGKLFMITREQQKMIYALIYDIGHSLEGLTRDNRTELAALKITLKTQFVASNPAYEMFSMSNCDKTLATDFIEWLLVFVLENDVQLSFTPDGVDLGDKYYYGCIKNLKCAICGQHGEIHHIDAIGMGRNRNNYDDSEHDKICLCRKHHTEAETIGKFTFYDKYHVKPVKVYKDGRSE